MIKFIKDAFLLQLANVTVIILSQKKVQEALWAALQYRPRILDYHWVHRPNSIEEVRFEMATRETALYVTEHMPDTENFAHSSHVINYCMDRLEMEGEILEFGVYQGKSINIIAKQTERKVHGFDSFRGLPEQWGTAPKGTYDTEGKLPEVADNVELHVGLFDETLPDFVANNPGPIALLHIDCDLYSSTSTVFTALRDKIVPGTKIIFDEYFNYPGWQNHEYKAFQEFIEATGLKYEYIAYTDKGFSAAVTILE